eukprot:CAMPEP_0115870502 /NCGR_PEP_ID=MMETSP0287-20121206/22361_1 /TAXON_ID=412157 /ORGANISM="Chrysochromulina rotalis, Strain UIO044" /LENGTH=109 /DNA_ID=CAMNT_0003325229 /DNA_START=133 /DNA_END=463 /DNA_ORIENTATION=+
MVCFEHAGSADVNLMELVVLMVGARHPEWTGASEHGRRALAASGHDGGGSGVCWRRANCVSDARADAPTKGVDAAARRLLRSHLEVGLEAVAVTLDKGDLGIGGADALV